MIHLQKFLKIIFFLFWIFFKTPGYSQPAIPLKKGNLKAVFANNYSYGEHHKKGYNGIAELYHIAQDSNLFVPLFSGINLEHIFGGDSLTSLFEPRKEPMTIHKQSDDKILLHQPPTTLSQVESRTTFEIKNLTLFPGHRTLINRKISASISRDTKTNQKKKTGSLLTQNHMEIEARIPEKMILKNHISLSTSILVYRKTCPNTLFLNP